MAGPELVLKGGARYLSEEEIQILKHEFDQYDADKGENITVEEFGRVMKTSGQNPSEAELAQIIKEVDLDGDGTINFDEFIAMMTGRSRAPAPAPAPAPTDKSDAILDLACKSAWKEVDPSLERKISAEAEFQKVMGALGESLSEAEVADALKGGGISYQEFVGFVKRRQVDEIVQGYGA
ncbi:Calmodulin [Lachnellula cervina]|uniref:Calmodulin n=1 Tax=Lachnellula cervina TaxID=1316786 RepID=A0A7D8UNS1_9HELO|nr:Calmodulin [Lachnellula cervina]